MKMVTPEAAKVLVQGLVISKLAYCNVLLLGVSDQQLIKLHKIQNLGCCVFNNLGKYDHATDSMKDLHWLKVPECIQFKALGTVYQCVNVLAPSLVKDLLNLDLNRKSLRWKHKESFQYHGEGCRKLEIPPSDILDQGYGMMYHNTKGMQKL